jgi:hypothetical protein
MSSSLYIFIIKLPEDSRSNMFMWLWILSR